VPRSTVCTVRVEMVCVNEEYMICGMPLSAIEPLLFRKYLYCFNMYGNALFFFLGGGAGGGYKCLIEVVCVYLSCITT